MKHRFLALALVASLGAASLMAQEKISDFAGEYHIVDGMAKSMDKNTPKDTIKIKRSELKK